MTPAWSVRVLPVALEDLAGIARYYRGVAPGQVARFRAEYRARFTAHQGMAASGF